MLKRPLRFFVMFWSLANMAAPSLLAQEPHGPVHDVAAAVATFVDAFNNHDADAVAAVWSENAMHQANATGTRTEGRKSIADRYRKFFELNPDSQLAFEVVSARAIAPTVISLEGVVDIIYPRGEPTRSEVHAILTNQSGRWLLDQVHETQVNAPTSTAGNLSSLAWLVGTWKASSDEGTVVNTFDWAANGNFLVRDYSHQQQGTTTHSGVQFIGWDAEDQSMRIWNFDGSGGFAEGVLNPQDENTWVGKIVFKLPDGRRGSLTQVFERTDDGNLVIQAVDQEIDGELQPNSKPLLFTRTEVFGSELSK